MKIQGEVPCLVLLYYPGLMGGESFGESDHWCRTRDVVGQAITSGCARDLLLFTRGITLGFFVTVLSFPHAGHLVARRDLKKRNILNFTSIMSDNNETCS